LVSKEEELLAELLDESSSLAQEMTMKLRRNTEKIMSICLTRFPIWFRRTQVIPSFGRFYKKVGILLGGCLTVKN